MNAVTLTTRPPSVPATATKLAIALQNLVDPAQRQCTSPLQCPDCCQFGVAPSSGHGPEGGSCLRALAVALAELHALIDATYGVPHTAPSLLPWVDGACERELNRRRAFDHPLQRPESVIRPIRGCDKHRRRKRNAGNVRAAFARRWRATLCALVVVNRSRCMSAASPLNVGLPEGRRAAAGRTGTIHARAGLR